MAGEHYGLHALGNLSELVESPGAVVQKFGGREMARELVLSRGQEEQSILEVRHIRELEDLVVIVYEFMAHLLRGDVNEDQVFVSQLKDPRELDVLSL